MSEPMPLWDLEPLFPSDDKTKYQKARQDLKEKILELNRYIENRDEASDSPGSWLTGALDRLNGLGDLYEELMSYLYCRFSTDTRDTVIVKELNSLEQDAVALKTSQTRFREVLGNMDKEKPLFPRIPELKKYHYFLGEELFFFNHQMSLAEENLAADLGRSGAEAWGRLQESLSSTVSCLWDEASGEKKTVIQLRALAFHADPAVRRRAFEKELELWKQSEKALAAALNGIKGTSLTLSARRHYSDPLEASLKAARISRKTLDALIGVMTDNLPVFRRYLKAKARYLGKERLAFYDLFAPLSGETGGATSETWSFDKARDFIILQFSRFSREMGDFAEKAFRQSWIDAPPREGKIGGAYCTSFPLAGESRVLCNFDGSFDALTTVAHELGHAYHHEVLKDEPSLARQYPMTLAETASIFAETVVFNQAYQEAPAEERLPILETYLSGATQVIVDILSRFQFESGVFEKRREGELGPEEFCDLMTAAQKATYGEALDPEALHPYMWAVKGHYYIPDLDFYNFPYAFGQLFGTALYGLYQEKGEAFAEDYRTILSLTGLADAEDVTARAGFDITGQEFWQSGVDTLARWVDEYEKLTSRNDK